MAYARLKTEVYEMLGGINVKASPYANSPVEFREISNMNFFIPGALTKRPGTTLYGGATVTGRITSGTAYNKLNGSSYIIVAANTNLYSVTPSSFNSIQSGLANEALFDFVTFVDYLFAANGSQFFKYNGSNITSYSLPVPPTFGATFAGGGSLAAGVTTTFLVTYGYVNERGYYGPAADGVTVTVAGTAGSNSIQYYGMTAPSGFGVTAIALYRSTQNGIDPAFTTFAISGATTVTDPGWPLTELLTNPTIFFTLAPKYLELYNNQLFLAGATQAPSTVFWSQIGEPEGIEPAFNAEFRTNDGDVLTGMKTYSGSLVVTKRNSVHRLTGDNPNNFALQEISDQYGCLSNKSMVQYEDYLLWLDRTGVVQYDGANIGIFSQKVEDLFLRMNYTAALDNATSVFWKKYNEVWFSIPVDGATFNNTTVVYDFFAKAWTTYNGNNPSALFLAQGATPEPVPFFGGYTGTVLFYGSSLTNDFGTIAGMTCSFKSVYHAPLGQTNESQFRQFYLNTNSVLGMSNNITINLRQDYGASIQVTRQMSQSPFQNRIDFGIPARSLSAEVIHTSATLPLQVNGYALAHRFQRDV